MTLFAYAMGVALVLALSVTTVALSAARPAKKSAARKHSVRPHTRVARPKAAAQARRSSDVSSNLLLNPTFDSSVDDWSGVNAKLVLAHDGNLSSGAAQVVLSRSTNNFAISANSLPVSSTIAGAYYASSAWVRSATPGRRVCIRMREWNAGGVAQATESCLTSKSDWQQFPRIALKALGGRALDVYVYEWAAKPGDSFELDGIYLVAVTDTPAPLAPPSALRTADASTSSVTLAWTASPDSRTAGYRVARDTAPAGDTASTSFTVGGLDCGRSYGFTVRALDGAGVTSTPISVQASTAACAPPPPPTDGPAPLFGADSPLNQPIAASPELDPSSSAMVQQLVSEVNAKGWAIATKDWTAPIFYADASTPRRTVAITGDWFGFHQLVNAPLPANAVPSADDDHEMLVVDRSANCVYDYGRAVKNADGSWSTLAVNALSSTGSGIYPNANSMSASGFSYAAGKIRPEELQAGVINHALSFTMHNTKAGGAVWPATGSDGWSTLAGAIPEGGHVQLDPSLDLDSLGLKPWQKTIARALQRYGMYLFDTGGAVALNAQMTGSSSIAYPWGDVDMAYMPSSLASHLRVLKTGTPFPNVWRFVPNPCADLR